jgi:hypothetical protein
MAARTASSKIPFGLEPMIRAFAVDPSAKMSYTAKTQPDCPSRMAGTGYRGSTRVTDLG